MFNPAGASLPPSQEALEQEYKTALARDFGINFNELYAITNPSISRYLDYLLQNRNYEKYMSKLFSVFNPAAAGLMCAILFLLVGRASTSLRLI